MIKDLLLVAVSGYVGWYLALNEKEATLNALKNAKEEALRLKNKLAKEIETNEQLNSLVNGIDFRSKNNLEALNNADGSYELDNAKLRAIVKEVAPYKSQSKIAKRL